MVYMVGALLRGCTCLRSALPLARARSAPTKIMVHFYSVGALETSAPPEVALNSEKFTLP